jgi:hypothetical protein
MQHDTNLDFPLALIEVLAERRLAATDYTVKCRGIILKSGRGATSDLSALVWMAEQLPPAIAAEIEFIQAHCANDLLVCVTGEHASHASLIGRVVGDVVAERFGAAWITVEFGDERKALNVESDGTRSWVVQ